MSSWPTPPASGDPDARHRVATGSSMRTGMTATVVAGAALALAAPSMAASGQPDPQSATDVPAALLRLLSADQPHGQAMAPGTMNATVLPAVAPHDDALPPGLEVARLVKAAGLAEAAQRTAEPRPARSAARRCDPDLDGLGQVKPWARTGARFLSCLYDEPAVGGVAQRASTSERSSSSLAVDIMVRGSRGDRIAACALANREELGVNYVMWRQRANHGDGWERMPDRGGDTANHRDHVHISFEREAPDGDPLARRCR